MKRFSLFILLGTLLICQNVFAQVSFSVQPPTRVYEGDRFPITFRLSNADGSDLNVSDQWLYASLRPFGLSAAKLSGDQRQSRFIIIG